MDRNVGRNLIQMHATSLHISMKLRSSVFHVIQTVWSVQALPRINAHTVPSIDNLCKTRVLPLVTEFREIVIVTRMQIRQIIYVKHMIVLVDFSLILACMARNQSAVHVT